MSCAARRWSDHAVGNQVGEAVVWCVERGEFGDRATPIGHDHFFTSRHAIDVPAQTVLQFADSDLGP